MMPLRCDDDLIEAGIFLCTSGRRPGVPPIQLLRFHRERERLYGLLDPDERNRAFVRLNLEWFREWGLERTLAAVVNEFPHLSRLDSLAVRKARGREDEGAELYVNETGQRNGLLALRPERLAHDATLAAFLRHEFTHLQDMLDPSFGYSPDLASTGLNPARQRLARERYRLLWDITVDGRLSAARQTPMAPREQHAAAFARAFSFWPADRQAAVFEALWHNPAPRHADFLALLTDPRGLAGTRGAAPGASCPLCDFPTFDWADAPALPPAIIARITAEFPSWSPDQGLCGRCLECYRAATAPSFRPTPVSSPAGQTISS